MLTRRIARRIIPRGGMGTASHHQNHLPRATARHLHLHRIHLPSQHPTYTPYALATSLQESLAAPHHAYKAAPETDGTRNLAPPRPSLLSFTPAPTYTLGRRQRTLDGAVEGALTAPLSMSPPTEWPARPLAHPRPPLPLHPHLTVRSYARLLEDTTSHLLRTLYGIEAVLDPENPGVWARRAAGGEIRKIAAMGIHLRRHVATLGIALNLTTPVSGAADANPWARFVPCGIEGREVTSVEVEVGERGRRGEFGGRGLLEGEVVAGLWADEFVRRLERGDGE